MLLGSLPPKLGREVLEALEPGNCATVTDPFAAMRSGAGFPNDLVACPDTAGGVSQPTLLVASRNDGAVPFTHSETQAAAMPRARLLESSADSHLIWVAPDYPNIAKQIQQF